MSPRRALVALLVAVVLAGCSGDAATGTVDWRGLDVTLPEGWAVDTDRPDLLTASDGDLGTEIASSEATSIDPDDNDVVALQFTNEPSTTADDWRALVTDAGGTIEQDQRTEVGGLPATSLTFAWVTNGVPTRERVVLVPSRELVLLFQPVPVDGQTSGPQVFLDNAATFQQILDSIRFGAPADA